MARYAVFRQQDGLVSSFVEWDGNPETWQPPAGCSTVQHLSGNIGDTWNGVQFIAGPAPQPGPDPDAKRLALMVELNDIDSDILVVGRMQQLITAR